MSENSRILSVVVLMLGLALAVSARAGANAITPQERLASVGVAAPKPRGARDRPRPQLRAGDERRASVAHRQGPDPSGSCAFRRHGSQGLLRPRSLRPAPAPVRRPGAVHRREPCVRHEAALGGRDRPDVDREPAAQGEPPGPWLPAGRCRPRGWLTPASSPPTSPARAPQSPTRSCRSSASRSRLSSCSSPRSTRASRSSINGARWRGLKGFVT